LIRWSAVAVIVLLAAYFVMRALATACTGAACDVYIPVSLLIPVLPLAAAAVTGIAATLASRGTAWFAWLLISTAAGVAGPPIALFIFKNGPDAFVVTAAALTLQVALVSLAYSFLADRA
jgi:hypothetical protein